eukprot:scaffold23685_cov206-Cylindrotheca_fusiformis.AAC.2
MTRYLDAIECSNQPFDISFHPNRDHLVACALVDGTVEVHDILNVKNDEDKDEHDSILSSMAVHTQMVPVVNNGKTTTRQASCRALAFSTDGERLYTGGSAGDLATIDTNRLCTFTSSSETNLLCHIDSATEGTLNPLVAMLPFRQSRLLATGDDLGGVRIWDERLLGNGSKATSRGKLHPGCILSWKENEDYISAFDHSEDGNTLLSTSADGRLAVFDLRMARGAVNGKTSCRLSDDQEDELLSLQIMKNGRKVVCGSQEGVLSIFSWNTWGDCSDRFPGHPSSIDTILKVDEDTLLTGSSDGLIRVVQIQPDKFVGILGNHGDFPIEKLQWNSNQETVGSMSHDNYVRLWDASILHGRDDTGSSVDDGGMPSNQSAASKPAKSEVSNDSEDDWKDSSSSDDDEESDEEEAPTMNEQRKKRLKTDNEKFFDDL